MGERLLADATTVSGLTAVSGGGSFMPVDNPSWVGIGMAVIVLIIILASAILLLPRFFDRMLNIGPIMGIVALVGAAATFPYAVNLALTPTRTSTSAAADINVENIQFIPSTTAGMLTIQWTTSKAALSAVRYGEAPDDLGRAAFTQDPAAKKVNHETVIIGLESGKRYYFEIVVGERRFNKDGAPLEYLVP